MRFPTLIPRHEVQIYGNRGLGPALVAPVVALALGACGGGDAASPGGAVVRDSAGVRIVEYAGTPTVESPFTFAAEPVYTHGAGNGDYLFNSIRAGRLLPDGSVVISDSGNTEIVLFGPDDNSSEVIARSGEGPGEVGFVISLFALSRDSLLLEDDGNARFTLFVNGSLARTVSPRDRGINRGLRTLGIDPAGQLLMTSSSYRRGFEQDWLPGHMVRFDLDTEVADTVASYDWVPFRPPEGVPENPFPHFGLAIAAGGQFVYGRTDTPELVWRRPDGSVGQVVRWQPERVYPTEEHWNQFEDDQRAVLPRINPQVSTEAAIEELIQGVLADYRLDPDEPLPLFGSPFGDDEGRVWLAEFVAIGSRRVGVPAYTVFSPDGEWLGKVDVPAGLRILDVAGGRVLGVVKDDMDIESIVVYELVGS